MELRLDRYLENTHSTLGRLYIDGKFACYTCEDAFHQVKVYGETRIPQGSYPVYLRLSPSHFDQRYKNSFPDMYKGMLQLQGVPGYEGVLIHTGNSAKDTEGCILLGNTAIATPDAAGSFQVLHSMDAFKSVYPQILGVLQQGDKVHITITDPKSSSSSASASAPAPLVS